MVRDDVMKAVERPTDIGTSTIAPRPPKRAPAHEAAAGVGELDNVGELEALNEKARAEPAARCGRAGRRRGAAETQTRRAAAKQSAAE